MSRLAVVALVLLSASSAFAQIIYEPVQYQYRAGNDNYYYGGSDPRVFRHASRFYNCGGYGYGGANLHRFDGGQSFGQPSPMYDRERVYTDCFPLRNAARFGYTAADARNEAYANAPTYFRKSDLLAAAEPAGDGTLVVPAQPQVNCAAPVRVYGNVRSTVIPPRGGVIIIPKRMLDRPVKDFEKKGTPLALAK